jgi:hypothetical protein
MNQHSFASKLDPDWDSLCHLRDIGRNHCVTPVGKA